MASREFPIVGDSLVLGYRFQRHWDLSMANAFFCGELGAGLFLVGLLYGSVISMIVGVSITAILKTYFHLSHMGVPGRSWRAMLRPDRSWISRGAISIVIFSGAAILHILLSGFGVLDTLGFGDSAAASGFTWIVKIGATAAAMFVMTYHGFAIADSTSISFWNTGLMPISSFSYSALGGLVIAMNLDPGTASATGTSILSPVHSASLLAVIVTAIIVLALLQGANRASPGAKMSLRLLTRQGPYVKWFFGLVLIVGLVVPFMLLLAPGSWIGEFLTAVSVLVGYYTFRLLVFRVGLYDPPISFAPES
jgi:formate-dependent nitrite reductase membrane component NrfD